jgi:hypothetical protein
MTASAPPTPPAAPHVKIYSIKRVTRTSINTATTPALEATHWSRSWQRRNKNHSSRAPPYRQEDAAQPVTKPMPHLNRGRLRLPNSNPRSADPRPQGVATSLCRFRCSPARQDRDKEHDPNDREQPHDDEDLEGCGLRHGESSSLRSMRLNRLPGPGSSAPEFVGALTVVACARVPGLGRGTLVRTRR